MTWSSNITQYVIKRNKCVSKLIDAILELFRHRNNSVFNCHFNMQNIDYCVTINSYVISKCCIIDTGNNADMVSSFTIGYNSVLPKKENCQD